MKTLIETLTPNKRKGAGAVLPLFRADEVRQTLHDMMNHLTVINLTCFKIRRSRENAAQCPALVELQGLENSAAELIQLSQQLTEQFNQLNAPHRSPALLRSPKAQRKSTNVFRLFK